MRKEVVYALIAGAFMGIVIAFGVWRANSVFKPNGNKTSEGLPSPAPSPQFGITIAGPDNLSVIGENPSVISGITLPNSWTIISLNDNDYIFKSEKDGSFSREVKLEGGINQLQISAVGASGEVSTTKLTLVYSTEFPKSITPAEENPSPTPNGQNASEGSEIRQKVIEKVERALKNPKALLGTVTDISTNTLQIESSSGEIQQISVLSDSAIVNTGNQSKEVNFSDIAIGDFVVGMGYRDENDILEVSRILISDQPDEFSVKVAMGKIITIDKKTATVSPLVQGGNIEAAISTDTYFSIYKNGKVTKVKLADISENDLVIIIAEENKGLTARTIMAIPAEEPSPPTEPATEPSQ